jgi:hypothetical protein
MKRWSPEEDALLARVWRESGQGCRHMFPDRTLSSIRTRAQYLRVKRDGRKRAIAIQASKPEVFNVTRVQPHDDEPLLTSRFDKRTARGCYGFIPGGPVASIFHLASAIGGKP